MQASSEPGGRQPRPPGDVERLLRRLPAVDRVLESPPILELAAARGCGREFLKEAVNAWIDGLRQAVRAGELDAEALAARLDEPATGVEAALRTLESPALRPVVNATGVVIHTNLGRSPWSAAAADRVAALAGHYVDLEYDLATGQRGGRGAGVARHLEALFPGTASLVVNNNAAAVLLVINTFAEGREVVVSRGQLVEIGGSFRIPEVMTKAGAVLREVGTTNRTRLADYEAALGPRTGLLMAVHPSNYRVVGFTGTVPLGELAELGRRHDVPVVEDLGSGNLMDLEALGIADEPTVAERLATGVDLVTFSADKLLGGPQAGLVVGRPELVARVRANHLYRALRVDKSILLALEATLAAWRRGRSADLPTVALLQTPLDVLERRAHVLATRLGEELPDLHFEVVESVSRVGGGAAPGAALPSRAVAITGPDPDDLASRLRRTDPPVIARIHEGRLLLDLRTLRGGDEELLVGSLCEALYD